MKEKKNRIKKDLFNGIVCKEGNRQTAGITLIAFIIGVIIASSISVYATSYFASQVTYKDGKTVEQALNDLYGKVGDEWEDISNEIQITANNDSSTYKLYKCGNIIKLELSGNFGNGTTEQNIGNLLNNKYFPKQKTSVYACGSDYYIADINVYTDGRISVKQRKSSSGTWISGEAVWISNN